MMRWSGTGVERWGMRVERRGVVALAAVLLAACAKPNVAPPPAVQGTDAPAAMAAPEALSEAPVPAGAAAAVSAPAEPLDIREIKVIDDNGQHGVFLKLTRPPAGMTHYTLAQPTRVIIEIAGANAAGETRVEKFPVTDPVISEIRLGRHEGKLRVSVELRSSTAPSYSVNDLNDTIVAFIGEPTGGNQPVREQVVFTHRAVENVRRAPQPVSIPAAPHREPPVLKVTGESSPDTQIPVITNETTLPAIHAGNRVVYHGQHVSLDFKDADIHNVLRLLAEVSHLNIVATEDVRGKVTLRLFDVPWDQALDIVLQVLNLESEQEGNVVRISTVKRLREEREELEKAQEAAKAVEPLRVEYMKVNYAKATKLAEIISGAARAGARGPTGGARPTEVGVLTNRGSVFVDEFSNTLIVRDIQRGIDNARELVRRLDVQTPQVLIESNIVEATTDFARDLGVQWGYRASLGPQTGNPTGLNFPGTVGIGGSGLGVGSGGVPFMADFPAAVTPGAGSALDLALGSIDGAHALDLRLSAFERQGRAKVISRPRVVTLNNVAATIKSLTIIRVKLPSTGTVINTGAGGAAGAASTATEKIETGIILVVTPQVSSDGFVLLDMFAKSSQADFTRTVDQIPTEISREANSHILVKNGQTVVLGGIYRDNFNYTRTGLPFFKDIPALGWFFRDDNTTDRREDLLVFLTPRIMTGTSEGLPTAEELWRNRERGAEG